MYLEVRLALISSALFLFSHFFMPLRQYKQTKVQVPYMRISYIIYLHISNE